ncbi:MAG: acetylxylan esterase [Abditibacteriaceae bacterium]
MPNEFNYDESKVLPYELPKPLICEDGTDVTSTEQWKTKRRPEILALFNDQIYGYCPDPPATMCGEIVEEDCRALNGFATRRQIKIWFRENKSGPCVDLLLHFPNARNHKRTFPAFLGYNFEGNHSANADPAILINPFHQDKERGATSSRWPLEMIIERGYASATACYWDVDPDKNDLTDGVHALYYKLGQTYPAPNGWGAISAWAWGLSRILDYLETVEEIDATRVAVHGHSRLGKTALWAAARDERFALAISNNSGCGGAALSRRSFGETIARINTAFPYWFCDNFKKYNDNEPALPIDQHELISLIAPRPAYVASATEDLWADPFGEFLSVSGAEPVYELFGKSGLQTKQQPEPGISIGDYLGYHLRVGEHDVTKEDWEHFLSFTDRHFSIRSSHS